MSIVRNAAVFAFLFAVAGCASEAADEPEAPPTEQADEKADEAKPEVDTDQVAPAKKAITCKKTDRSCF
jgi:hypothetical protein